MTRQLESQRDNLLYMGDLNGYGTFVLVFKQICHVKALYLVSIYMMEIVGCYNVYQLGKKIFTTVDPVTHHLGPSWTDF